MVSAVEQLSRNANWGAFAKATELKKRIWFVILALLVFALEPTFLFRVSTPMYGKVFLSKKWWFVGHVQHVLRWVTVEDDNFCSLDHALYFCIDYSSTGNGVIAETRKP